MSQTSWRDRPAKDAYGAGICHFRGRWLDVWDAFIQERP